MTPHPDDRTRWDRLARWIWAHPPRVRSLPLGALTLRWSWYPPWYSWAVHHVHRVAALAWKRETGSYHCSPSCGVCGPLYRGEVAP